MQSASQIVQLAKEGAAAQQEWRRLAHIAAQGPEAWEAERQAWIEVFFPFSRIDFLPYRAHLRLYSCTSISNLSGTKLPPLSPKAVPTVLDACAPGLRQGRRPTPEDAARSLPAARTRDGREAARERPPPPLSVASPEDLGTVGGQLAEAKVAISGGVPPYAVAVDPASAPLPGGISIGSDGSITGTATEAGSFSVTLDVADSVG